MLLKKKHKLAAVLLSKTPGLSPVKTRLARHLGKARAEEFYRDSLRRVCATIRESGDLSLVVATAEKLDASAEFWTPTQPDLMLWQGDGGLGHRMARVAQRLLEEFDSLILLGGDTPHLPRWCLTRCHFFLSACERNVVIGPAIDGGFYLLGVSRSQLPLFAPTGAFANAPYSHRGVLASLARQIQRAGARSLLLPPLNDIDEVDSYWNLSN